MIDELHVIFLEEISKGFDNSASLSLPPPPQNTWIINLMNPFHEQA